MFNYTDHLGNIRMSYTQTPTGALSILEENHYYPFGLKHTNYNSDKRLYVRESVSSKIKPVTPLFPLVYNYKFNGKEWQDELELNVTAMDFRQYDSAIGRFYGMDGLAELAPGISPYRFAFNNPVFWSDPTGLSEERGSNITGWVNNGKTIFWDPKVNNQEDVNRIYGGGNTYVPDNTEVVDINGSTKRLNPDGTTTTILNEVVVTGTSNTQTSNSSVLSDPLFWINSSLGFGSLYVGYKSNFHLQNEVWHQSKNGIINNVFEKSWSKLKYKNVRTHQTGKLQLPRNINNGLAVASLVMTGVNVYKNGELKASDVFNASMAAISFTGVGSVVAGIYFVADLSTMGVSYLTTGEAKGIGTYLDENTNGGVILNKNDF
ncbi:RHS repeat domain-containing protein [Flavobacterium branchiophilum]|uniref:RHS repeat domain-containing protein n=1 Tax=Flavobacterium branchiophilum TaxID=55197 RepID=UPI001E5F4F7F|nr:RHS repeat-associated core domain-containing protein [Flavobacterium branchiophilum]